MQRNESRFLELVECLVVLLFHTPCVGEQCKLGVDKRDLEQWALGSANLLLRRHVSQCVPMQNCNYRLQSTSTVTLKC